MKSRVLLVEMTREEIRAIAPGATVVLPTAAIEQHGPHLPIFTDTLACTTVCQRAAERASERTPVVVAPPVHFGSSHHHLPHPGVMSLTCGTFTLVVKEMLESLERSGFRRIAIINGHGGNDEAVRAAAREFSLTHAAKVAAASYWTIAWRALIEEGRVTEHGDLPGHAGAFETSLVLALRPDTVRTDAYPPTLARPPFGHGPIQAMRPLVAQRDHHLGFAPGYTDQPAAASAELGHRCIELTTHAVAEFLVAFAQ